MTPWPLIDSKPTMSRLKIEGEENGVPETALMAIPRLRRTFALIETMVFTEKAMAGVSWLPLPSSPHSTKTERATKVHAMGTSCSRLVMKMIEGNRERMYSGNKAPAHREGSEVKSSDLAALNFPQVPHLDQWDHQHDHQTSSAKCGYPIDKVVLPRVELDCLDGRKDLIDECEPLI